LAALDTLKRAHDELVIVAEGLTEDRLFVRLPGQKTDAYFQLMGILQHDIYHAGPVAQPTTSHVSHFLHLGGPELALGSKHSFSAHFNYTTTARR
jgi:hypothetical protein